VSAERAPAGYGGPDIARWAPEPPKREGRSPFERDRARVLHSSALRRLAAKTQVMEAGTGDFPRTRLTHSLECAQIGRELARALGADPDLVEAACLAHDLGHPPFGHNGELALAELARPCGGFEGNAQSLRLLTRLEAKVFADDPSTGSSDGTGADRSAGLNLTRATLDATLKYPWIAPTADDGASTASLPVKCGAYPADAEVFGWIRRGAPPGRCLEAQVMDWADDVAYSVHDLEDGLHAGHIVPGELNDRSQRRALVKLTAETYGAELAGPAGPDELAGVLDDLLALGFWPRGLDGGPRSLAALKNLTSELIGRLCLAAEEGTRAAYPAAPDTGAAADAGAARGGSGAEPAARTRYAANVVVPRRQRLECALLKAVTAHYVMSRPGAAERQARQRELIAELAAAVEAGAPGTLDPALRPAFQAASSAAGRLRVVVDQIASLTDISAVAWHRRLCVGSG
jgi:dGTPase